MKDFSIVDLRREFHEIAEPGWLEIKTTIRIIQYLKGFGYDDIRYGKPIHKSRIGVPDKEVYDKYIKTLNLDASFDVSEIKEGYTGAIAILDTGIKGPTIGMRFDIDANEIKETKSLTHLPNIEGFRSKNDFAMHACGHDGHTAIGLSIAKWLMEERNTLTGKFILIFQPAEEGVRGAKGIVETGILDDVDYFLAGHIGPDQAYGKVGVGTLGFLATEKLNIYFKGYPAHAGTSPETGKNALLAAASCALNLHTLPQFGIGSSRLNVGVIDSGPSRNIIPHKGKLEIEIRGETKDINKILAEKAKQVVQGSAKAFDVEYEIELMGAATSFNSYDEHFLEKVACVIKEKGYEPIIGMPTNGSEDVTFMMDRVVQKGGKAVHLMYGTNQTAPNHNDSYDFDEDALTMAFDVLTAIIEKILN